MEREKGTKLNVNWGMIVDFSIYIHLPPPPFFTMFITALYLKLNLALSILLSYILPHPCQFYCFNLCVKLVPQCVKNSS